MQRISAAIVGLGNIGFLFDLDEKRSGTWSHARAYSRCSDTELIAAVEPDREKAKLFAEHYPGVQVFASLDAMFAAMQPALVSICTPTATHHPLLLDLVTRTGVRGVICEKPFAANTAQAREMVQAAAEAKVTVAVNHTRRWTSAYIALADAVQEGRIGRLVSLRAIYPGQVRNIGSHLLDVLTMAAGRAPVAISGVEVPGGGDDPHIAGRIFYGEGLSASFDVTGKRERLIFEVEAIGEEGRIVVQDNGRTLKYFRYAESPNYNGYLEPVAAELPLPEDGRDPLLDMICDTAAVLQGKHRAPRCTGADGLASMAMIEALLASIRHDGATIPVNLTEKGNI
ncbi:MAG: Gfo/Idh/MocA family oxidoreductase [Thermodesulfobacteriota bacterium]